MKSPQGVAKWESGGTINYKVRSSKLGPGYYLQMPPVVEFSHWKLIINWIYINKIGYKIEYFDILNLFQINMINLSLVRMPTDLVTFFADPTC